MKLNAFQCNNPARNAGYCGLFLFPLCQRGVEFIFLGHFSDHPLYLNVLNLDLQTQPSGTAVGRCGYNYSYTKINEGILIQITKKPQNKTNKQKNNNNREDSHLNINRSDTENLQQHPNMFPPTEERLHGCQWDP